MAGKVLEDLESITSEAALRGGRRLLPGDLDILYRFLGTETEFPRAVGTRLPRVQFPDSDSRTDGGHLHAEAAIPESFHPTQLGHYHRRLMFHCHFVTQAYEIGSGMATRL